MHPSSLLRMRWFIDSYLRDSPHGTRVLDVGSFDVNGTYRPLFDSRFAVVGLDIEAGPNVDLVVERPYE